MKKIISALMVLLLLLPAGALAGFAGDYPAIEVAAKSVLMLEVYGRNDEMIATGSGFMAFDDQTLVTNAHVLEDALYTLAYTDGGKECFRLDSVIASDEDLDIAILRFAEPTGLQPLQLAVDTPLYRGEPVVAIGSPQGITNTVSMGNISLLYQQDDIAYIQFTAPISSGSSGGALFNDNGEVIGVTSAIIVDAEGGIAQNLNLAVRVGEVAELYEQATVAAGRRFAAVIPEQAYGEWETTAGNLLHFRAQVQNTSSKTIAAVTLYCYPEDAAMNRLIGDTQVYQITSEMRLEPNEMAYSEDFVLSDAEDIAFVNIGVHSVRYADGSEEINPDIEYSYWVIE